MRIITSCMMGACMGIALAQSSNVPENKGNTLSDCVGDVDFAQCVEDKFVGNSRGRTRVDHVDNDEGGYDSKYRMANALDSLRQNHISPYLQWIVYIGVALAILFITYNALLLVFTPMSGDQSAAVRKRIMYVIAGLLVISGFYILLRVLMSILVNIL